MKPDPEKVKTLQSIYNSLPKINCKKLCHDSCGPIAMYQIEHERIVQKTGKPIAFFKKNDTCSCLQKDKTCKIYPLRPFICRLFGLVEKMRCPHGCEPERWLSDQEAYELMDAIENLSRNPTVVVAKKV